MKIARLVLLALVVVLLVGPLARSEESDRDRADALFEEKNYKDAAQVYEGLVESTSDAVVKRHASRRVVLCYLRLQQFDAALEAADAYVERVKDTPWAARAHRLAGNLWLNAPHWGTRSGGTFHRAQWLQGMQVRSFRHDKKHAVRHLETARDLYAAFDEGGAKSTEVTWDEKEREAWRHERLESLFDLAGACGRFGIYENDWTFWWGYWAERDDFRAETAGEDDFDAYHGDWELQRKRPIGLRLGSDGKPRFTSKPKTWASDLGDEAKILYLLDEIRGLDTTEDRRPTALSYYRQGMLARARFGMDRLNGIAGMYWSNNRYPLQEEMKSFRPWEMEDGEALVLAGGKIRVVDLPPQWDVFRLLGIVSGDYQASGLAPQALYATGLHRQTRQQYRRALRTYETLREAWPKDKYAEHATLQIDRIRATQIHVNQTGVQVPGEPARLQISYRNTSEVHFVARRIDLVRFFEAVRNQKFDVFKGPRDIWALQNWHAWFVQNHNEKNFARRLARICVQEEVARWSDHVENDGTHRYAEATLQMPLDKAGAYLVYAYQKAPPLKDEKQPGNPLTQGMSRAVVVLTDLALVEKAAKGGRLYFVADARTGAPIPEVTLDISETWSVWDQKIRKSRHYRAQWQRTTDRQGLAFDPRPKRQTGRLHVLASAGKGREARLAWSGMRYWNHYSPSHMQSGTFAWIATDRPVYRPGHTVRYKAWLRRKDRGEFQKPTTGSWQVQVFDPRGTVVHQANGQTDEFGGLDGQFALPEEPTLGVYRVHISGTNWQGGQNFRVEEYKKPEFEVKVEPATRHAKLGETLKAKIQADYYFGAPVTDATVKYKVFREEYRHAYYAPGPWDWLYGSGYGFAWYPYTWYPWWGEMLCCRVAPRWWWGYYGHPGWTGAAVRELVSEGDGRIGEDGGLEIEIDTSAAARDHPDLDHRYVIQAEVRDASRRVITGEGAVKVTRQAYYAMVNSDRGWYRPGEEILLTVRCLTPDNEPVETDGVVTVTDVVFRDAGNAKIEQTELQRFRASTNERGELEIRFRHERSGQLRFSFESPDAWGGIVRGHGHVWVCGEDFEGQLHRFNDLELITDKRTYAPGETARVLVNTKRANSWVLFGNQVDSGTLLSWTMLHLAGRSQVVDVPVEGGSVPNFFVEATTVSDVRVHQQTKRICVPPTDGVIDVQVVTDQATYDAGGTATVKVTAKKPDGSPAEAQVTLSAFDRSVLYIQGEYTPAIAKFFHGNLRTHQASMMTNLLDQFSSWGGVARPYQAIHPAPPAWFGIWGPTVGDWRRVGDETLGGWGDTEELAVAGEARSRSAEGSGSQVADACASPSAPASGPQFKTSASLLNGRRSSGRGGGAGGKAGAGGQAPAFAEAEVRKKFADTALWQTTLRTGADGTVETTVEMPENLTTWKVNAWGMTRDTQVGQASTACVTTKNLIVRLQAPRFFLEYDEVVLSANVHNYLDEAKTARVSLEVPEALLKLSSSTPATVDVEVAAGGEARVDWRVHVVKEGWADLLVKALTDEESDAVMMGFPVLVHGMTKQVATTGSMRPQDLEKTLTVELDIPEKRRPELTRLEVQYAPSLVGSMLDALPYCLDYPYGCTEQTVSRFLPAVLTLKTLQHMGIDLAEVKKVRGRMAELRRIEKGEGRTIWGSYAENPIFDDAEMQRIIQKGLGRIGKMQQPDGGWGWWTRDDSSPYLTSYVLYALLSARDADVAVPDHLIQRGVQFLLGWAQSRLTREFWAPSEHHAFVGYVLSLAKQRARIQPAKEDKRPPELLERLYQGRDQLNLYGKSLLSLALANVEETPKATTVLENVLQYVERNDETQVAWLRTPDTGWWYWWNSDVETNAWALRALVRLDPKSDLAPRIVKWLLNNRQNGYYWRSTRDTTLCVAAMSEFVMASGEGTPDYTLRFDLDDGQVVKEVKINKDNFFTYDNRFVVEGVSLAGGTHTLKVTKTGPGALYLNSYLSYFTKEEHIAAAGHELNVERRYFLLKRIPYEVEVEGAEGQTVKEKRLRYERVPLKDGDSVESGDLIQVELEVESDNNYTYLAFEDMKPAGCEPTQLRSGGEGQEGFWSYMELRDEKVVFFVASLQQGKHLLRYRLRAEIPGTFHALPTRVFAMYVPELKANSDEMILKITDR